jgi:predicted GNAT family acetyltransferase
MNGVGRILFGDGTMYEGTFREGKKHGKFKVTLEDGSTQEKYFVDDVETSYEDYISRYGVNSADAVRAAGYSIHSGTYEEETVMSHFSGVDLPALHNVVKTSLGSVGDTMRSSVTVNNGRNAASMRVHFEYAGGSITRDYTRNNRTGELSVYHAYFKLPESLQGGGAGKKIMAEMLKQYKRMGVNKVGVTAGLDGGGYTWALYGFHNHQDGKTVFNQFLNPDPNNTRLGETGGQYRVTQTKLRKFIQDIGEEKYQALIKFCQSWPNNKPFPMHVIANQFGASGKAGADFLRGTQWAGVIDMTDRSHVEQWENYVNPQKLAERERVRQAEMAERAAAIAAARATTGRGRRRQIIEEV